MNKARIALLLTTIFIGGCGHKKLPYDAWWLGFAAPNYMEVWIETADVVDAQGRLFRRAMSGGSAIQTPPHNEGNPRGWPKEPGWGKGKFVYGADLPKNLYVRWQSLAEPQVYRVFIDIPENKRAAMLKGERAYCMAREAWMTDYRKGLAIHLAPGGIAKVWLAGPCLTPIEVGRFVGEIVPQGPHLGKAVDGKFARPPNEASRAYIEKFGIPFDSW
ncbi:DUF2931 family protein [Pseudomonas sp. R5(2019)]|uniref:DUF2931 family protein n=1 Tax=Pseudomonas sp. R5(2019) TaxID=2697566 RepID=UPI001412852F|nr:DUF2931 family protein [Pseudomonas sp. R5(2019)]NBA98371.1 DUF2931 family protein [Pseudomonas sp. R5(2019)]